MLSGSSTTWGTGAGRWVTGNIDDTTGAVVGLHECNIQNGGSDELFKQFLIRRAFLMDQFCQAEHAKPFEIYLILPDQLCELLICVSRKDTCNE